MAYDEKDAVCLFKLREWNEFIDFYKSQLQEMYEGLEYCKAKIAIEAKIKTIDFIDDRIKEEFLC